MTSSKLFSFALRAVVLKYIKIKTEWKIRAAAREYELLERELDEKFAAQKHTARRLMNLKMFRDDLNSIEL
jgi:hypothetical protein